MNNTPYETLEQQALFDWAKISGIPDLELLHAIPNGGHRNKATAGRLKAEGVKRGVPDIFLPVPKNGYHGMYIEMKRQKGGKLSVEQKEWCNRLFRNGYKVFVAEGWVEAREAILEYLRDDI